jgi:hypothetical protein
MQLDRSFLVSLRVGGAGVRVTVKSRKGVDTRPKLNVQIKMYYRIVNTLKQMPRQFCMKHCCIFLLMTSRLGSLMLRAGTS